MDNFLKNSASEIVYEASAQAKLTLERSFQGNICRSMIQNATAEDIKVKEVIISRGKMPFAGDTKIYAEGYNMLSQTKGTIAEPQDMTPYSDRAHYRLPSKSGFFTAYNLMLFAPSDNDYAIIAFSSCRRYAGFIRFNVSSYEIGVDLEGTAVKAGASVQLEDIVFFEGEDHNVLLAELAAEINKNITRPEFGEIPVGWCSWQCFGPSVTEDIVSENLHAAAKKLPALKYIQIDDGYFTHAGDWLSSNKKFPNGVKELCLRIKAEGFEPAMWVAPFIAEKDSDLFRDHPDWFVKDDSGDPLASDKVTFGGWAYAPWYMLDTTNPAACEYLRKVFGTMRREWQVKYFKLDANMWGALPFGHRYDANATSIDAYHAGMKAILESAGEDSYILGCNAPMWASIGYVHGMRIAGDISRDMPTIKACADEICTRMWQNSRLWINDPDAAVLENRDISLLKPNGKMMECHDKTSANEYAYHYALMAASGGALLSGDDIVKMTPATIKRLEMLMPPAERSAEADDMTYTCLRRKTEGGMVLYFLNKNDTPLEIAAPLAGKYAIRNVFSGREEGEFADEFRIKAEPCTGYIFSCRKIDRA